MEKIAVTGERLLGGTEVVRVEMTVTAQLTKVAGESSRAFADRVGQVCAARMLSYLTAKTIEAQGDNGQPVWRVMRDCCTSGNCDRCMEARRLKWPHATPLGTPLRVVQMDRLTKQRAEEVAAGWVLYKATAEPMVVER